MAQLETAMAQVNLRVELVQQLVITHAHIDHWGQSATVMDRSGCDLWMHPDHRHATAPASDPEASIARRLEVARQSGVPEASLAELARSVRNMPSGVARLVEPDHELVDGVVIDTDLGGWRVYETPGHAPSHVCLYQPERRLLISGDHLLGRVSLVFEFGWTPDPIGEFLHSLEVVDGLDARLCMSGHGRTFTDVGAHIVATRALVGEQLASTAAAASEPRTAVELASVVFGEQDQISARFRLGDMLCFLHHLERTGALARGTDADGVERWSVS